MTAGVRGQWTYPPEAFQEDTAPHKLRLVALREGIIVATGRLAPFDESAPDAMRLDLAGDQSVYSQLYLALLAQMPTPFKRVLGVTREDWAERMGFFAAAGFRNAWQSWGASLNLLSFDFAAFQAAEEKKFLEGYETERWRSSASAAEWDALYALHQSGEADVPRNPTTMPAALPRQEWEALLRQEEVFVVRYRGEIVALTRLALPSSQAMGVESEFTAVHSTHRSQGLALLVKAHALAWAKGAGYTQASTGGSVLNIPLLRVNTCLGYLTEPMWVTWEKKF